MKLNSLNRQASCPAAIRAFTLAEMLIAFAIFMMVVGAMVYMQLLALRIYTLAATKLSATSGGRQAMFQIREQVRSGKIIQVGNCTVAGGPSFAAVSGTNVARGNALQIYPTTNVSPYVIYYLDRSTTTNKLVAYNVKLLYSGTNVSGSNVTKKTLANYITNTIIFDAEDYRGNVLTNDSRNNRVYGVTLQFYQWEYPVGTVGAGAMYDYYQLRTRATRRAID